MISLEGNLRRHVALLAAEPRTPGSQAHEFAKTYIQGCFTTSGLRTYVQDNGRAGQNIVAEMGSDHRPLFVIGAHYDSVPASPGADDNASAVAALLELAEEIDVSADAPYRLQFVAYDQEESGIVGSLAHVERLKKARTNVYGMISLEMLGYTGPKQTLVPGVDIKRERGDFVAIVANTNSAPLLDLFQPKGVVPVEKLVVPDGTEAALLASLSDHSSFWAAGWKALLVTDTAFLRNPHYHKPTDTPDALDYKFLTRTTELVASAIRALLNGG